MDQEYVTNIGKDPLYGEKGEKPEGYLGARTMD